MRKRFSRALGSALLILGSGHAIASASTPDIMCDDFLSAATPYVACVGLTGSGNISIAAANLAFADDADYSSEYKDDNTAAGSDNSVVDLIDNGNNSFTLKFLQNVGDGTSTALVGLRFVGQGTNQLGYFRFDSADFDIGEMLTFSWDPLFSAGHIKHAGVYSNIVTPGIAGPAAVPEPATYALMLAGLAAAGVVTRRRRPD